MTEKKKRRFALRRTDVIVLGIVAAMVVAIIALGILQRCGLTLVNNAISMYLPFLALFILLGWGGYVLCRNIRGRGGRIAVGAIIVIVLFLALTLGSTYLSFIATVTIPQRYTAVASPSGARRLVVLRVLDPDDERIEARRAARLAADPNGEAEVTAADWGYVYRAYPQAGLFYRSNADVEGEIHLTYDVPAAAGEVAEDEAAAEAPAKGTLMLEWLDDEATAHFFVENPGVGEGGDCYVRFLY